MENLAAVIIRSKRGAFKRKGDMLVRRNSMGKEVVYVIVIKCSSKKEKYLEERKLGKV